MVSESFLSLEKYCTGDFNIQMDNAEHPDINKFNNLLETFGLIKLLPMLTNSCGHTLDMLIIKAHESPVLGPWVTEPLISDHQGLLFQLDTSKPKLPPKEITYRKLKSINPDACKADLETALHRFDPNNGTDSEVVKIAQSEVDPFSPTSTQMNLYSVSTKPNRIIEKNPL